jgi:biopolymer transport protein ExbD
MRVPRPQLEKARIEIIPMIDIIKEPISLEALGQQVKASAEKDPELVVIINADDQALHGAIVSVMDEVRLAGVSRLAIAVRPERKAQP